MSFHDRTTNAARGKWRGILRELGVSDKALSGKHAPCPVCEGVDRFRFDDREGRGTSICNVCGARDGMKLAMDVTGQTFREVASRIDALVGNLKADAAPRRDLSDEDRTVILRRVYGETRQIEPGDVAHRYLAGRHIDELIYPRALRFHPAMRDGDGGVRPAMVAMVGVHGEAKFCSMHRTFLRPDGSGKAEMTAPRKLMPGPIPDGACVMLSDYTSGPLGIAEGIETAMSASALFDMPVWAAINATMLAKWIPPQGCEEVAVFGDNDFGFGGQAAAFTLAHRLAGKGIQTTVHIPDLPGTDWADVWMRKGAAA